LIWPSKYRRIKYLLYFFAVAVCALCIFLLVKVTVLCIGDKDICFYVRNGDIIVLEYTQSMYGVPVQEKLRIADDYFILFHVYTTEAALEYYGIEGKSENNVMRVIKEFVIPEVSVGNHTIRIKDNTIALGNFHEQKQNIRIRLTREPLLVYFHKYLRR